MCDLVVTLLLGSETVAAEDMASTKLIDIDDAPTSVFHNGLRIGVAALEMLVDIVSMSPDNPVLHSGPITPGTFPSTTAIRWHCSYPTCM